MSAALSEENCTELVRLLNTLLANSLDLYTQAQQAHWNVKGDQFSALHRLFDEVADQLREHADEIAQRVATLGGLVLGTARMAVQRSEIPEFDHGAVMGEDCIRALLSSLARQDASVRNVIRRCEDLDDLVMQEILVGVANEIETDSWMLQSHLEPLRRAAAERAEQPPATI